MHQQRLASPAVLFFFLAGSAARPAFAQPVPSDRFVETCDGATGIQATIEAAQAGDRIVLPNFECTVTSTITVRSGLRITGQPNTTIVGRAEDPWLLFGVERGATKVTFEGMRIRLSRNTVGFRAVQPVDLRLSRIEILGNGFSRDNAEEVVASGIAVWVEGGQGIVAEHLRVEETLGGLYFTLAPKDLRVTDNRFRKVALGNIVVGGRDYPSTGCAEMSDGPDAAPGNQEQNNPALLEECAQRVWILRNTFESSGIMTQFDLTPPGGDAVSISGARDIVIQDNVIKEAKCYGLWLQNVNQGTVKGNTIERGLTVGVFVDFVYDSIIQGNTFNKQGGNALLLQDSLNVLVAANTFLEGRILIYTNSRQGKYLFNTFLNPLYGLVVDLSGHPLTNVIGPNY